MSGKLGGGVVVVEGFQGGVVVGAGNLVQVCYCSAFLLMMYLIFFFLVVQFD